ncbi:10148_t:CDS:2 [Entrophospora sp. SA101]|nr:10148_t:CDS:2 [Entrophospora sp. SA101]
MGKTFTEKASLAIKLANLNSNQLKLLKNPPISGVSIDDFLPKNRPRRKSSVVKKAKNLNYANQFILYRRYYEKLERTKNSGKKLPKISEAAGREWENIKTTKPEIVEYFKIISLINKEYKKMICLEVDDKVNYKWKPYNAPNNNNDSNINNIAHPSTSSSPTTTSPTSSALLSDGTEPRTTGCTQQPDIIQSEIINHGWFANGVSIEPESTQLQVGQREEIIELLFLSIMGSQNCL